MSYAMMAVSVAWRRTEERKRKTYVWITLDNLHPICKALLSWEWWEHLEHLIELFLKPMCGACVLQVYL
jgi:hypothetical protein